MGTERSHRAWAGVASALAAILAPKCPACLAAYLSYLGLGVGAASLFAPLLRPAGIAILALCAVAVARRALRRTER
jgi:hypothetical protein